MQEFFLEALNGA